MLAKRAGLEAFITVKKLILKKLPVYSPHLKAIGCTLQAKVCRYKGVELNIRNFLRKLCRVLVTGINK